MKSNEQHSFIQMPCAKKRHSLGKNLFPKGDGFLPASGTFKQVPSCYSCIMVCLSHVRGRLGLGDCRHLCTTMRSTCPTLFIILDPPAVIIIVVMYRIIIIDTSLYYSANPCILISSKPVTALCGTDSKS